MSRRQQYRQQMGAAHVTTPGAVRGGSPGPHRGALDPDEAASARMDAESTGAIGNEVLHCAWTAEGETKKIPRPMSGRGLD